MTTQAELFAKVAREAGERIVDDPGEEILSTAEYDKLCERYGCLLRVAREDFAAVLVKTETYPSEFNDEVLTTWRFSDDSIAVILSGVDDETREPMGGFEVLSPVRQFEIEN